jgi:hypothetical protein
MLTVSWKKRQYVKKDFTTRTYGLGFFSWKESSRDRDFDVKMSFFHGFAQFFVTLRRDSEAVFTVRKLSR